MAKGLCLPTQTGFPEEAGKAGLRKVAEPTIKAGVTREVGMKGDAELKWEAKHKSLEWRKKKLGLTTKTGLTPI